MEVQAGQPKLLPRRHLRAPPQRFFPFGFVAASHLAPDVAPVVPRQGLRAHDDQLVVINAVGQEPGGVVIPHIGNVVFRHRQDTPAMGTLYPWRRGRVSHPIDPRRLADGQGFIDGILSRKPRERHSRGSRVRRQEAGRGKPTPGELSDEDLENAAGKSGPGQARLFIAHGRERRVFESYDFERVERRRIPVGRVALKKDRRPASTGWSRRSASNRNGRHRCGRALPASRPSRGRHIFSSAR